MIIRKNIDWLSFTITNISASRYYVFENLIEYYNLEKQDYRIRGCEVAYNDYMNVFSDFFNEYILIELKPLYFWRYLPELLPNEDYYIDYILMMLLNVGYKTRKEFIKFNRVDLAIDYIGQFVSFEDSFKSISQKKIKTLETIRNVGLNKTGLATYLNGSSWNICRYEKTKEILVTDKSYYPDVYRNNNIIRLEIRLKKQYLKNYDTKRQKFFYLFKKLIEQIDDTEMNKLNIFDNVVKIKSINNNIKGEYMILREKIFNDILLNIEQLQALDNVYLDKEVSLEELITQIRNRYKPKKLKERERHYRFYLNR